MQKDLRFMRGRILIRTMMPDDATTYYSQCDDGENVSKQCENLRRTLNNLNTKVSPMIFVIENLEGKFIGIIKCIPKNNLMKMGIEILNEEDKSNYGIESIREFLKICREESLYEMKMSFDFGNDLIKDYIKSINCVA